MTSFQTSSNGTFFTSTSWDGSVRMWSILQVSATEFFFRIFPQLNAGIAPPDLTLVFWQNALKFQLECSKTIRWNNAKILCSALAADDRRLITGSADSTARIIDLETGKVVRSFPDHIGPVVDLKLMSKDELLVTGSGDFAVMVWDLANGTVSC